MAPAPRRRCLIACCWPLSGHHWYRPVHKHAAGVASCHAWPYSYSAVSPRARRLGRGLMQYGLITVVLSLLIIWLGTENEQFHVRNAPSTTDLYQSSDICGILVNTSESSAAGIEIETFASVAEFRAEDPYHEEENESSNVVAHCGACGSCSNPNDVLIYDNTRNTLFQDSTKCAKMALIFGRKTATKCMAEAVGFTPGCNDCWVENIMCDLRYCIFTCLWYGLFSQVDGGHDSNSSSTALNPCTHCDEMRCGRKFVMCAGANRRRAGMLSDIERDTEKELCRSVTDHWWNDASLQDQWRTQHGYEPLDAAPEPASTPTQNTNTTTTTLLENDGPRRLRR